MYLFYKFLFFIFFSPKQAKYSQSIVYCSTGDTSLRDLYIMTLDYISKVILSIGILQSFAQLFSLLLKLRPPLIQDLNADILQGSSVVGYMTLKGHNNQVMPLYLTKRLPENIIKMSPSIICYVVLKCRSGVKPLLKEQYFDSPVFSRKYYYVLKIRRRKVIFTQ